MEKPDEKMEYLPEIAPTLKAGLHFLLPVAALIWNLMVEQLSPALSAFWATLFLMFILVTQRPLFALFRGTGKTSARAAKQGFSDLFSGLVTGARNMIGIGDRHRDRRHHRRHGDADRHRPGDDRTGRGAVGRQPDDHADPGRPDLPDPRHGPADHGELHRGVDADGAGDRRAGRADRAAGAADRGAHVRVLLRPDGRRDAAGGSGLVRGGRHRQERTDADRPHRLRLQRADGDPAVHVHLQHPVAADRYRQHLPVDPDDHHRDGGEHDVRGGNAGLLHHQEPGCTSRRCCCW
jgi:hypothetical protein